MVSQQIVRNRFMEIFVLADKRGLQKVKKVITLCPISKGNAHVAELVDLPAGRRAS